MVKIEVNLAVLRYTQRYLRSKEVKQIIITTILIIIFKKLKKIHNNANYMMLFPKILVQGLTFKKNKQYIRPLRYVYTI